MATTEQQVEPGRRTAGLVAGGVGVVTLAAIVYYLTHRPVGGPPPSQPVTSTGLTIASVTVTSAVPGQPMTAQVVVQNPSPAPLQDTISGQVTFQGATVVTFAQQPVSVAGGQSATVTVQSSGPIPDTVAGDTVTVTFTLSTSGAQSVTTTQIQGAAQFAIVSATITPSPVQPGQQATASVVVANSGQAAGTVTVSGVITYQGQQVGTFTSATSGTVQPSQTFQIPLTSANAISPTFAGKTLTATFVLPNGQSMQAALQVAGLPQIVPVNAQVTSAVAGQYAEAVVTVANQGQGPGTIPGFTSSEAETTYNGQVVGHWIVVSGTGQTLGPGDTATVSLRSDGPMYSGFVGQTLEAVFTINGGAVSAPFTVQAAPATTSTGTTTTTSPPPSSTTTSTTSTSTSICSSLRSQYNSVYQQLVARAQSDIQQGISSDPELATLTNELNSIQAQLSANGCG